VARVAAQRGLTHLAVTDHGVIEGALEALAAAPPGLTVIVGQEVRTREGDLIGLFMDRAIPAGLSAVEAAAAVREQGGLVGLAHPFDRFRGSTLAGRGGGDEAELAADGLAALVDYVETFNARVPFGGANERAAEWARRHGLPGVAVSDAHTLMEVGVAYAVVRGPADTPATLRGALAGAELVASRGSLAARLVTPLAKAFHRLRGDLSGPGEAP
jgi:hypothetical protein